MASFKNSNLFPPDQTLNSFYLSGLSKFKRILERDFFSEVTLQSKKNEDEKVNLVIHIRCNFNITDGLFHLKKNNWGGFQKNFKNDYELSIFYSTLKELENKNKTAISIEELSIHFNDTSLIIGRLPDGEIHDHLEELLTAIGANFVHFTKGLAVMPSEIFVPIYEQPIDTSLLAKIFKKPFNAELGYWGIYFDNETDAQIYDVKNKVFIEDSDLSLLSQ